MITYRNSGSSTNWSSRGSDASRSESAALGGALAVANVRNGPSHKPHGSVDVDQIGSLPPVVSLLARRKSRHHGSFGGYVIYSNP